MDLHDQAIVTAKTRSTCIPEGTGNPMPEEYLTIEELSAWLKIKPKTVKNKNPDAQVTESCVPFKELENAS
jgi:hypothetical protein